MVRRENLITKLENIDKYFQYLKPFRSTPFTEIRSNPERLASAERFLYLLIQSAIDLAEMVVKLRKWGKPETMSQAFEHLLDNGYLDETACKALIQMVGFRNALSHGYESFNYSVMERVLKEHLDDVLRFAETVRRSENL